MKKNYNVGLSNESGIFDERNGFETADEAVNFATGRGSSYIVNIDAGKCESGEWVKAVYFNNKNIFKIDIDAWGESIHLTPAQFADYIRKNL